MHVPCSKAEIEARALLLRLTARSFDIDGGPVAIGKVIERPIEDIVERMARWLVVKWPFQQKGLPFYLWGIMK